MKYEIDLILPTFLVGKKSKRGIITSLITGFIGLAYKGISSFLHQKRHKVLHRVVNAMNTNMNLEKIVVHLEDSMVMYGVYNSDTLEQLIDTVHRMHNHTTWNEKIIYWTNPSVVSVVLA